MGLIQCFIMSGFKYQFEAKELNNLVDGYNTPTARTQFYSKLSVKLYIRRTFNFSLLTQRLSFGQLSKADFYFRGLGVGIATLSQLTK